MICASIGGTMAKDALPRVDKQVLSHDPDLVIVCFGLNDVNGTLEEYLPGVEKYLEEKAMRIEKKPSVTADLQSKKMQVAGEKKKETKRDCKKSETVI